jgi:hypothetical protein
MNVLKEIPSFMFKLEVYSLVFTSFRLKFVNYSEKELCLTSPCVINAAREFGCFSFSTFWCSRYVARLLKCISGMNCRSKIEESQTVFPRVLQCSRAKGALQLAASDNARADRTSSSSPGKTTRDPCPHPRTDLTNLIAANCISQLQHITKPA